MSRQVEVTDHDLGVMDEAVEALFRANKAVQAIALGSVALRLRGLLDFDPADVVEPLPANVVELHAYSQRVS